MDRILKILKKENAPRASSAPALELNTIIFKHVYGYMQQISGERLQDHWSSGLLLSCLKLTYLFSSIFIRKTPLDAVKDQRERNKRCDSASRTQ